MKLLYLDFNNSLIEDYSAFNCNKYGGGRIVAAHLLPHMISTGHYMEIWADNKCFENIPPELRRYCKSMRFSDREAIGNGKRLEDYGADNFDIVLHHYCGYYVNTEGLKTIPLYWAVGYNENINAGTQNIILYNDFQFPRPKHPNPRFFRARIGVPLPPFIERKKHGYAFSCHRQTPIFGSQLSCIIAKAQKLDYYFAGPLEQDKSLLDYCDNKTKYLGIISEEEKVCWQSGASMSFFLHSWPTPFNLSAITALAYGTPIIASPVGFWPSLVKNGVNGYIVRDMEEMAKAIDCIKNGAISQENCYNSVKHLSADLMVEDYMKIFNQVLNENLA